MGRTLALRDQKRGVRELFFTIYTLCQWFLTGDTRTPWGYEALKQGVRSTKLVLRYTPRK